VEYFQRFSEDDDGDDDTSVSVDFSSTAASTLDEFTTTFSSANSLTVDVVLGSWEVLLTLGLIFVISAVFISYGYVVDTREEQATATSNQLKKALHMNVLNNSKRMHKRKVVPDVELNPTLRKKRAVTLKERSKTMMAMRRTSQRNQTMGADEHRSLDQVLPTVLQPLPMWTRYKTELQVYHRWAGVYFHYSKVCSRPLRALSLVTNVIVMLFIEAVTYDIADPNDGSCELYASEPSCLSEMSSLASESKCYWDEDEMTCNFKEIKNDMMRVVIVAIFAACLGTPFAILLQVLVQKYLSGEVDEGNVSSLTRFTSRGSMILGIMRGQVGVSGEDDSLSVLTRGPSMLRKTVSVRNSDITASIKIVTTLQEDLSQLFTDLRKFRHTLSRDERNKFDDVWGLSFMMDEGIGTTRNYFNKVKTLYNTLIMKRRRPELVLLDELERVRDVVTEEVVMFESSQLTESQKSKRLLFLFVRDLLDGANGQILDAKNRRDNTVRKRVTMDMKIIISLVVTLTLLGMLFYVYLFALRQTQERQQAWFQSFVVWVVFEIFLVSTGMVFLTHIVIPTFIVSDVKRVKQKIVNDINAFKLSVTQHSNKSATFLFPNDQKQELTEVTASGQVVDEKQSSTDFNAAKYLFASSRLARLYPNLKDSLIVARFSTHWPRRSLKNTQKSVTNSYNKKLSFVTQAFSRILLFGVSSVIQLPEPVQDIVFQLISTSGLGYIVVLFMYLWRTSPLLVAVPLVVVVLCVHFITATSKSSSFLPLNKVQPLLTNEIDDKTQAHVVGRNSTHDDGVPVGEVDDAVVDVDLVCDNGNNLAASDELVLCSQKERGPAVDFHNVSEKTERLRGLQHFLWGNDIIPGDNADYSSDTDSDANCDEFFNKRKDELAVYEMACLEARGQGCGEVGASIGTTLSSSHIKHLVVSEPIKAQIDLQKPSSKSSPVAAALTVNSRAGALKNVRRKSSLGISSIISEDGGENDIEVEDDEDIVERILQRPKEILRCVSNVQDSDNISGSLLPSDAKFSRRSEQVEARLRNDFKKSVSTARDVQLENFSCPSSDIEDERSVHLLTKKASLRNIASSDSEIEYGSTRIFSAPSIKDDIGKKSIESDKAEGQVRSPVDVKYPFNLNESMFELSEDSDD
jgi:hypothetical protein